MLVALRERDATIANLPTGRRSWLFLGEVITLLTFLGYHALPDSPDYQPNFMVEVKRRIYYQIFNTHMVMVSLTGRPPREFPDSFSSYFEPRQCLEASETLTSHSEDDNG